MYTQGPVVQSHVMRYHGPVPAELVRKYFTAKLIQAQVQDLVKLLSLAYHL